MKGIEDILAEVGKEVEAEMERLLPRKGIENLNDAIWYHLDTGGKKLRPALAVLTCKMLGGDVNRAMPFAAACEIMHNWFLVHDDIEDGDTVRRDMETVWKKYGLAHGINVGDYLSDKVYELIIECGKRGMDEKTLVRLLKEAVFTCIKTAEGQTLDINLRKNNNPAEEVYMKMIEEKTGYYLTMPIVGGAIVAGAPEDVIKKVREVGMKMGPAFQIIDDLLDMTEGKGRKEIGADVKEGKRSVLVVHCSSECNEKEKEKLFEILNRPREETTKEDVSFVKALFDRCGSIVYAQEKAKSLIAEAKELANGLQPELRDILNSFADYIIERKR